MADKESTERRGTITGIELNGGLAMIYVRDGKGDLEILKGDNGPTVRALMNVFGTDIVRGASLQTDRIIGQEIGYDTDDLGLLAYITE